MQKCTCTPRQIEQYLGKISHPFLDRIDICVEIPRVPYPELENLKPEETSEKIRERITKARKIQTERYKNTQIDTNATLAPKEIKNYVKLKGSERELMKQAFDTLELTARSYHKILRVARTIADLEESEWVTEKHLKEAMGYRSLDKTYWGR